MFANIKHLLGAITLHEEKDLIKIEGISSFNLSNNIYEIWRTSKIFDNIFTSVSKNKIVFNKFFALDILYTIEKIISEYCQLFVLLGYWQHLKMNFLHKYVWHM